MTGTIELPDDDAALIADEDGFSLIIPDYADDDEVPMHVLALMAFMVLIDREGFIDEMIERAGIDGETLQ